MFVGLVCVIAVFSRTCPEETHVGGVAEQPSDDGDTPASTLYHLLLTIVSLSMTFSGILCSKTPVWYDI